MEALDDHGGMRHHLMCPISLQPMQDPVTAPTGISYDRRAIERWLAAGHATCPVTGQPLALADLTPNHTLRRLIQSWTWTPRPPAAGGDGKKPPVVERDQQQQQQRPDDAAADEVIEKLGSAAPVEPCPPPVDVLRAAAELASQSDAARRRMVHAGVVAHVLRILVSCATKSSTTTATEEKDDHHRQESIAAVEACLALLRALTTTDVVSDSDSSPITPDVVDALTDVLVALAPGGRGADAARASAVRLLEHLMEAAASAPRVLERLRLRPELFASVTVALRDRVAPHAALRAMLRACAVTRNRALIVEAGAAHEAIELELANSSPADNNRRVTTELTMALLADLCACAEGRAAVAVHPAGVAVVSRRLLRASSAAADACAVRVLAAVGGRAASPEVLREMAAVGAVGKLCCVLQADCGAAVKEAARAVLRMHSGVWSGSPCVSAYLLSRYL